MSAQSQGFIRDSRFGSGQVIKGTNRENTRKWRALGVPDAPKALVKPGECSECQKACCVCSACMGFLKGKCAECAGIPGVKAS